MAKNIVSVSKENSPVSNNKRKAQEVAVINKKPQPIPVANKDHQYKKKKPIKEPEPSSSEEEEEEEESSSEESLSEAGSSSSASEQENSDDVSGSDSEDSGADSDSSEEKVAKAPVKGVPAKPTKTVALKAKPESESDSDASSEEANSGLSSGDSEEEEEEEEEEEDLNASSDESDDDEQDSDASSDEEADSDASDAKAPVKEAKQAKGKSAPPKENVKSAENKKNPVVALASNNHETSAHGSSEFTVFVGNLAYEVTEDLLAKEFEKCGKIANARLVVDKATGRSKGIAYLDFTNKNDYESALAMKGHEIMGRAVRVDAASTNREFANKPRSEPTPILFIGNLSYNTTEKSLENAFSKFGPIMSVRIPTSYDKKSKGYGYVQFKSVESAKAAMEQPRFELDGRAIRLDYDGNSGQNRNNNRRNNY